MRISLESLEKTTEFGQKIGNLLKGGEVIELVGDVGAGKTTLAKGIAKGLGVEENVQSPSFTISNTYSGRNGLVLCHYDFYRLENAGIMSEALTESVGDEQATTVIEWAGVVKDVLPEDRLTLEFKTTSENARDLTIRSGGDKSDVLMKELAQ